MLVNLKTVGLEQNLSSVNIRSVIRDKNGFLWLSTQDGLNKYDGKNIIQFKKNSSDNRKALLGSDCFSSSYSNSDSLLYVISSYEGLNIININTNNVINKISSKILCNSKENVWIRSMVDYKDFLIMGTDKRQLIIFNKRLGKVHKIKNLQSETKADMFSLSVVDNEICVAYQKSGIEIYAFESLQLKRKFLYHNMALASAVLNQVTVKDSDLWIASNIGIFIKDIKTGIETAIENRLLNNQFLSAKQYVSLVQFNKDLLVIGTSSNFFEYDLKTNLYSEIFSSDVDKNSYLTLVNSVKWDNNIMWIGGAYGLAQITTHNPAFASYYRDDANSKLEHLYTIIPTSTKTLLAAADDGLYKMDMAAVRIKKVLTGQTVYSFAQIGNNEFLISGTKNLLVLKNEKVFKATTIYPEFKKVERELFICIQRINDSVTLMGSQIGSGVFAWNRKNHTINNFADDGRLKLSDLLVNNIWNYKSDSTIIISESSIEIIDYSQKKRSTIFNKERLLPEKADVFMDMCQQGNSFWVAAYGLGMVCLDSRFKVTKIVGSNEGICNTGVYKIFSIGDSLIVGTTNNGLCIYNTKLKKVFNYFKEDGLHSNAFEETSGSFRNDSLYLGGVYGFTLFLPRFYTYNKTVPKLFFNNISVSTSNTLYDTTNLNLTYLEIPNHATQTKVSFIGLNYENPNRVQYWYKIKEINSQWISISNQNFIDLIGLNPGKYTLQVKAANEDGVESVPIQMTLNFLPKWYQTLLFKFLVALTIGIILYALYRFRIRQLTKIIAVRQKISSNLHDDIGSTLSSINMYSQIAQLQPQDKTYINTIQENTQEVLGKLDDIVWATNPKNDKLKSVTERMDMFARPLLQSQNIIFTFDHDQAVESAKISEASRQNLFLIFKEAINNVAKYANCKNCKVKLSLQNKMIHCSITDDGIGFDSALPTARNGLLNMKLRATELKGKLQITSKPGAGTSINLQLPL